MQQKAETYAQWRGLDLLGPLGDGTQGIVWRVRRKGKLHQWALKIHATARDYQREVAVYERLAGLTVLEGFNVPALLYYNAEWQAVEMGIVARPYILDFAQAWLDTAPDFPAEVWEERRDTWSRLYSDDWPRVHRLLRALEEWGVFYLDVHAGNIAV